MKRLQVLTALLLIAAVFVCLAGFAAAEGELRIHAEGNAQFSREGETLTLQSGALFCIQEAEESEDITILAGPAAVVPQNAIVRVELIEWENASGVLVELFDGLAAISLNEDGQQAELVPGKAMLVVCTEEKSRFALFDEIDEGAWNGGDPVFAMPGEEGTGGPFLPIPFEKLPNEALDVLLECAEGGRSVSVDYNILQRLRTLGHYYIQTPIHAVTCTEDGLYRYDCTLCGLSYTGTEEALGHEIEILPEVAPQCAQPGLTAGEKCSRCGEILTPQQEVPGLSHTIVSIPAIPATCQEEGMTAGELCTQCGKVMREQEVIPMLPHTEVTDSAVEATCTSEGLTQGSHCGVCGTVLNAQEKIPKLPHTEEIIPGFAATCTEDGLTDGLRCTSCGEILTAQQTIPAPGHSIEIIPGTHASCWEDGLTDGHRCSVCGITLAEQTVIPAGHTPAETTVVSTLYADRNVCYSNLRSCVVCGIILESENISHEYGEEQHLSSETGCYRAVRSCTHCGLELDSRVVDHVVHEDREISPETGVETVTGSCAVCGKVLYVTQMSSIYIEQK